MNYTPMFKRYLTKFAIRLVVFLVVLFFYLTQYDNFQNIIQGPIIFGISPYHIFWICLMGIMFFHLFPTKTQTTAMRKRLSETYKEQPNYNPEKLKEYIAQKNRGAIRVLIAWLLFNALWVVLFFSGVIGTKEIILITSFYFCSDFICNLFYCPFGLVIMDSKCCVNCRIYDWGHFMMFSVSWMMFDFFGITLTLMGIAVLLRWEYTVAKHPEYMWEGSNQILQCRNCQDQTCQAKKRVVSYLPRFLHPYRNYPRPKKTSKY